MSKQEKAIQPDRVAIYVRWSTDDQGKGHTLEVQLEKCRYFLLSQGWNPNEELIFIDDGYSGATLNRPEMDRLRKMVDEDRIDCIVFMKLDRLSRSVVDVVNLLRDEWDDRVYVKSATEPFDTTTQMGKTLMYFLAIFAEWERETIRERTWGGKVAHAKSGKNPGFKAPYGYTSTDTPGHFELVEHEVAILKRIFREYLNGRGTTAMASALNSEGIKFRQNKPWNASTIRHIIKNPIYTGRLVYGKLTRNHKRDKNPENERFWNTRPEDELITNEKSQYIPAVISEEDFELAQKIRVSRDMRQPGSDKINGRSVGSPHLLGGFAKCTCGHNLVGRAANHKDPAYYKCNGAAQKGSGFCTAGYIRQDEIDRAVITAVRNKFADAERDVLVRKMAEYHLKKKEQARAAVENLKAELEGISIQKKDLMLEYRKKKINIERYNTLLDQIEADEKEAAKNLKIKEAELEKLLSRSEKMEELSQTAEQLRRWDELPIEQQKNILRRWVHSITIFKEKGKNGKVKLDIIYKWDKSVQYEQKAVS